MFSCPKAQSAGPGTDALITPYRLRRRPAHAVRVEMDAAGLRLLSCEQSTIGPLRGDQVRWSVHPHQPAARTIISQRLCISSLRQQPAAVGLRRCAYTRNASALLMLLRPGVEWCVRGTTSWVRCGSRGADVSASQASWRGEMGVIRRGRLTPMVTRGEMGVIRRGRLTPMVTRGEMGVIRRGRLSPMVTQCIAPPLPPVCFRGHTLECMLHNEVCLVFCDRA